MLKQKSKQNNIFLKDIDPDRFLRHLFTSNNVLIVGLGNPGNRYDNTRHNMGFDLIDVLVSRIGRFSAKNNGNLKELLSHQPSMIYKYTQPSPGIELYFLKPMEYMNLSGKVIREIASYYKIPTENIVVIYDDLDILFGEYKINFGKGPKDHNGLNSIIEYLGSSNFLNIRIGVESRSKADRRKIPGERYVLMKLTEDAKSVSTRLLNKISERILNPVKTSLK